MYEARLAAIAAEIQAGNFDWAAHALDSIVERTVTRDDVRTALTSGVREVIEAAAYTLHRHRYAAAEG